MCLDLNSIYCAGTDRENQKYWSFVMRIISYLATAILLVYIPRPPYLGLSSHRMFVDLSLD